MSKNLIITKNCYCEHYLHEYTFYPRQGLESKKLLKGDKVTFVKKWSNAYGTYITVSKDGVNYDILPQNVKYT